MEDNKEGGETQSLISNLCIIFKHNLEQIQMHPKILLLVVIIF